MALKGVTKVRSAIKCFFSNSNFTFNDINDSANYYIAHIKKKKKNTQLRKNDLQKLVLHLIFGCNRANVGLIRTFKTDRDKRNGLAIHLISSSGRGSPSVRPSVCL